MLRRLWLRPRISRPQQLRHELPLKLRVRSSRSVPRHDIDLLVVQGKSTFGTHLLALVLRERAQAREDASGVDRQLSRVGQGKHGRVAAIPR